jgi:MoaA/NifB/PqqE/SkfB family radical SAM enzyme
MKVQIEITSECNLNCEYCFRKEIKSNELNISLIEKINGITDEYILYGYGEPLLYPDILRIVNILDGKITLSTNGMVDKNFKKLVESVDRVGISVDFDESWRKGLDFDRIANKLKYLDGKGVVEVVITQDNLVKLKRLAELAAQNGLDFLATNVIAPNSEIYEKAVYFEESRRNVEMASELDEKFLIDVIREWSRGWGKKAEKYKRILRDIYGDGYSLNLLAIFNSRERIEKALHAEKIFDEITDITKSYGVEIIKPEFFGDAKSRECPFKDGIFVRADGLVSSCMSFAYRHSEFVNSHKKTVDAYTPANLNFQDVDEIIESMREFEKVRYDMDNFPWCADCPYVSGCWYTEKNIDCYRNEPSCSECLYSCKIARCLI